jgi:hypothetical protein
MSWQIGIVGNAIGFVLLWIVICQMSSEVGVAGVQKKLKNSYHHLKCHLIWTKKDLQKKIIVK